MSLSIVSFAFDQASYTPGEAINLTVDYTSTDEATPEAMTSAVTVMLSDTAGSASQPRTAVLLSRTW